MSAWGKLQPFTWGASFSELGLTRRPAHKTRPPVHLFNIPVIVRRHTPPVAHIWGQRYRIVLLDGNAECERVITGVVAKLQPELFTGLRVTHVD
jgi:hypothetical protein